MKLNTQPKLELLQALRAIACVAVVFFHTDYQPGFGASGVNIFFVLSGVIMGMLLEFESSPVRFIKKRFIRIIPLYWVTTSVAAVVTWLYPHLRSSGDTGIGWEYIFSLMFIPYQAENGNIVPLLGPGWSINYEMVFYVSCAVGLWMSRGRPVLTTTLIVISWWYFSKFPTTVAANFYHRPVVLFFIAGINLWLVNKYFKLRLRNKAAILSMLVLCTFLAYGEWFYNQHRQGNALTLVTYYFFPVFIVYLGLVAEAAFQETSLSLKNVFIQIGDASYAIYLTHLFVIHFFALLSRKIHLNSNGIILASVSVLTSIIFGLIVHRFFDEPLQKKFKLFTK